jgi:hypothetical protein
VEPGYNWRGSMMANAGRDPIFWATLAVAEQDFDGAGDLCIRCHSPAGWVAGRSTPTDGSALGQQDADGVQCDLCHAMTNPDGLEHAGVQNAPFLANDEVPAPGTTGYYGSGMYVLWGGADKLGPYPDAAARHQFMQSAFHRDNDFCGTCHDVSNPVVGDLAPYNGAQIPLDPGTYSGVLGEPVDSKAAFNNFPYQYGVVERTFSEFRASLLDEILVSEYPSLPPDLQAGAMEAAYNSALEAGTLGDYADNTPRYFNCQTCHMRPVVGAGCNKKGAPIRTDLPLHDMTGGNYWMPDAIKWLDQQGLLRLGGGLTTTQIAALDDGKARAMKQLSQAATLSVVDNTVTITNLTGHKLISGYPEGRRMWLRIKWIDANGDTVRVDGEYGDLTVTDPVLGQLTVRTLLNPYDVNTKVYEAHYGITQEWAVDLAGLHGNMVLTYDHATGQPDVWLDDLALAPAGTTVETFHFVLNNTVVKDNRIPPYGFNYAEAADRNALPVPEGQYLPVGGDVYEHWDDFVLNPPVVATHATIDLLYQPTSWEYIQFLHLANNGANPFLADEGINLLNAWLATGMAEPYVMASAVWGTLPEPPTMSLLVQSLTTHCVDKRGNFTALCPVFGNNETVRIEALTVDAALNPLSGSQVFATIADPNGAVVTSLQGFSDASGTAILTWKIPRRQGPGEYTVTVTNVLNGAYSYDQQPPASTVFTIQ